MVETFKKSHIVLRIIFFLIPFINLVVEIISRLFFLMKKGSLKNIIMFILVFFTGGLLGWIDFFVILFTGNYFLE